MSFMHASARSALTESTLALRLTNRARRPRTLTSRPTTGPPTMTGVALVTNGTTSVSPCSHLCLFLLGYKFYAFCKDHYVALHHSLSCLNCFLIFFPVFVASFRSFCSIFLFCSPLRHTWSLSVSIKKRILLLTQHVHSIPPASRSCTNPCSAL